MSPRYKSLKRLRKICGNQIKKNAKKYKVENEFHVKLLCMVLVSLI
jgi:hypothetical protein